MASKSVVLRRFGGSVAVRFFCGCHSRPAPGWGGLRWGVVKGFMGYGDVKKMFAEYCWRLALGKLVFVVL